MKKVTSILMAFVLMLTLIPTAWAEGESAGTMPELKDNVYKLENDVDLTSKTLTIDAKDNVTLDLNGYSIKVSNTASGGIDVSGELTLMDSTDTAKDGTGKGKIWSDTQYTDDSTGFCAIRVCGNGHFIMESGLIDTATAISNNTGNGQFAVGFNNTSSGTAATVTINGGHIKAGWYAVSGNGSPNMGTAKVVVNGGVLESVADYALYLPQNGGKAEINGGVIYGAAGGIAINRGELTVNNGTITSKGTGNTGTWGDGTGNLMAAAINVNAAYGDAAVTINGGKMIAETNALFITNAKHNGTITITGGTFSTNPKDYIPSEGYTVAKKDSVYTVSAKAVKEDGTVETTSAVKLEVSSNSDNVINTPIDKNDIEMNKELTVTNNKTAVTINRTGVAAIVGTSADLNLSIEAVSKTPESANTAAYNKAMADKDANSALVVNISLTRGASKVFAEAVDGAYALVTVPYSTDKADKLTVYYLNGSEATALTKVTDAAASGAAVNTFSYDAASKRITLKLPHFSEYLISTTATRSVVHHYGGTGTTTTTGTKTNSPTTFDAGVGIYAVSAILSVTGMAWVGTKQRKH